MQEINDKAYTLHLEPEISQRDTKGRWNKGGKAWNRGMKWGEMFDKETIERLKNHLREVGSKGNKGKGFNNGRPVIQMDEDGNRLHWYASSSSAARKLGLIARNKRSVCYGDRTP